MDVVYILSPARSGSTFLQFLLGGHPEVVGIGEVSHVLREYCKTTDFSKVMSHCTCGVQPGACPFWGSILKDLPSLSLQAGFTQVLGQFDKVFPDKVLLDSSKSGAFFEDYYLAHLRSANDQQLRLKILFLVRDFRGWVISIKKHWLRTGLSNLWNTNIIINSYRWLYTSIKWLYRIRKHNIPFLPIYYEHLVFDTGNQMQRIYDFLGLPPTSFTLSPTKVHELYGSPTMKSDPRKLSRVVYDAEWMQNCWFFFLGPIFIPPVLFNSTYAKRTSFINLRQNVGN